MGIFWPQQNERAWAQSHDVAISLTVEPKQVLLGVVRLGHQSLDGGYSNELVATEEELEIDVGAMGFPANVISGFRCIALDLNRDIG